MRPLLFIAALLGCGDAAPPDPGDARADAVDASTSDTVASDTGPGFTCPAPIAPVPARSAASPTGPLDSVLRVNHLQVKGTHNSYHVAPPEGAVPDWEYTHAPLDVQLDAQGVRAVELDVNWNPRCERYEVYHVGLLDPGTTCFLLSECLAVMRGWSDVEPGHVPIFVQIEVKDLPDETTGARLDALDAEIRAIWPDQMRISPDDVRGARASVRDGIEMDGWPTLEAARGKALFFLNDRGATRDVYSADQTSLVGRTMFAEGDEGSSIESVLVLNDPGDPRISRALAAGLLVRTRADSGGVEARANDTARLERALASGGHVVSTDFPAPVAGLDYSVEIPGGMPARCNPVTAPPECTAAAVALAR